MSAPARTAFLNASRPAARRALPRNARVPVRGYATEAPKPGFDSSHLVSGLLGGGLVLGGIYGYYKYTGADKVVSTAHTISSSAKAAKDKLAESTPDSASEALALVKSIAKSYAAAIPGGAYAVDKTFGELERFANEHGDEAKKVFQDTYADLEKAAKSGKDAPDAVLKALKEAGDKVNKLVGEQASKGWQKLGEEYPQLKQQLGEQGEQLQKLTEKHGPEAKQIATDFYRQASELVAKGGFNAKTYEAVKQLLQEKTDELSAFSQKAGKDAWDAAAKQAGPALEKMPDVKELVEKNLSKVEGYVGEDRVKVVKELYSKISDIQSGEGSIEDKTKKAKELVEEQLGKSSKFVALGLGGAVGKAGDIASQVQQYIADKTGLQDLTKLFDEVDLKALKEVATKRGEDGKKLADETYQEIKKILEEKSKKAKELAESTKEEAKKEAKK
ncbi:hypothetical protein JCM8097_000875 [Rhodosporidiobolus ruineniae]